MMSGFFVSLLISLAALNVTPPEGWMQNEMEFKTKAECEAYIPEILPTLMLNIHNWSGGAAQILKVECLQEHEWFARNMGLGHTPPPGWQPKSTE